MTYYRTDPYLAVTNPSILMQGAYSLENPHGARTGYVVLDFTRVILTMYSAVFIP